MSTTLSPVIEAQDIARGGSCQKIAVSTVSAQSAILEARIVQITPSIDVFVREGDDPVALADGTDELLLANLTQTKTINYGKKLAFITSTGTGSVYVAPVL